MSFMKSFAAAVLAIGLTAGTASAAGGAKHPHPPENEDGTAYEWSFEGPFGSFDEASLQRGYQVYREVCASCHGMELMSYRNLAQNGGPFDGSEEQAKAFAAMDQVRDIDDFGDEVFRPARLSDPFVSPYANEQQARAANGGALPPDLSVIMKARHNGPNYVYSLLTGYPAWEEFETDMETFNQVLTLRDDEGHVEGKLVQPTGLYYNPYFPGDTTPNWSGDPRHKPYGGYLAMAAPLTPDRVEYMDGTPATVSQMSKDVVYFLTWASEPKMENRKKLGLATMGYLLVLALLLYFSYRQIWRNVEH